MWKCEKSNVSNNLSLPESGGLGSSLRSLRSCPQVSSKTGAKPGGERQVWPRSGHVGAEWGRLERAPHPNWRRRGQRRWQRPPDGPANRQQGLKNGTATRGSGNQRVTRKAHPIWKTTPTTMLKVVPHPHPVPRTHPPPKTGRLQRRPPPRTHLLLYKPNGVMRARLIFYRETRSRPGPASVPPFTDAWFFQ